MRASFNHVLLTILRCTIKPITIFSYEIWDDIKYKVTACTQRESHSAGEVNCLLPECYRSSNIDIKLSSADVIKISVYKPRIIVT